jgi:hypothetical protein
MKAPYRLKSPLARKIFEVMGDDLAELGKHLTDAAIHINTGQSVRASNDIGLGKRNQEFVAEVARLFSQGRIEEGLKMLGIEEE